MFLCERDLSKECKNNDCTDCTDCVLDNIRTEIDQITDTMGVSYNQYVSKIDVLKIIDKYRTESRNDDRRSLK